MEKTAIVTALVAGVKQGQFSEVFIGTKEAFEVSSIQKNPELIVGVCVYEMNNSDIPDIARKEPTEVFGVIEIDINTFQIVRSFVSFDKEEMEKVSQNWTDTSVEGMNPNLEIATKFKLRAYSTS